MLFILNYVLKRIARTTARRGSTIEPLQFLEFFPMRVLVALLASLSLSSVAFAQSAPVTTASGLIYESLKDGAGESPKATDTVKVHYKGTFLDGKEFDSSYKRGQPTEFPLNGVIPCWTEGVQRMKPGGKAKLTCPPGIAYGARGAGGVIPPNATLNFEVELVSVRR
jgi:FKBP-type peptidyl-prolyl cis-trans isomerase FkpA